MSKRYPAGSTPVVTVNNVPVQEEIERFTTLSPMLADENCDHLADPPCFDGRVPPDPVGFLPPMEKPGKRGQR